jgi:hypothetical protein
MDSKRTKKYSTLELSGTIQQYLKTPKNSSVSIRRPKVLKIKK